VTPAMEQIALHETAKSPEEGLGHVARQEQLLTLVGELLQTNQELRFKVAGLERRAEAAEDALDASSRWSGFLLP
jgi:hypothetical protein